MMSKKVLLDRIGLINNRVMNKTLVYIDGREMHFELTEVRKGGAVPRVVYALDPIPENGSDSVTCDRYAFFADSICFGRYFTIPAQWVTRDQAMDIFLAANRHKITRYVVTLEYIKPYGSETVTHIINVEFDPHRAIIWRSSNYVYDRGIFFPYNDFHIISGIGSSTTVNHNEILDLKDRYHGLENIVTDERAHREWLDHYTRQTEHAVKSDISELRSTYMDACNNVKQSISDLQGLVHRSTTFCQRLKWLFMGKW